MIKYFVFATCLLLCHQGKLLASTDDAKASPGADQVTNNPVIKAFNDAYRQSQTLAKSKKFREAAQAAGEALKLSAQIGASQEERANLKFNQGFLLLQSNQHEAACDVLEEASSEYSKLYGKKSAKLINPLNELATCLSHRHSRRAEALKTYKRIKRIANKSFGEVSEQHALASFRMGQAMIMRLRSKEGMKHLERALDIFSELKGPHSTEAVAARFNIAKFHLAAKDYDLAINKLNSILEGFDDPNEPDSRLELSVHGFLVEAYEQDNQSEEATKHCLAIGKMTPEREAQDYIPLFKPQPEYPHSALAARKEGTVIVEFTVDEQGFVQNPIVLDRQGSKVFDKPSLDVVKKFRYAPAFVDGKAVKTDGIRNRIVYEIAKR